MRFLARGCAALVIGAIALFLLVDGGRLVGLGGSPYYVIAGAVLALDSVLFLVGHRRAWLLYLLFLAATLAWSLWESGLDPWALTTRLFAPSVLGLILLVPWTRTTKGGPARRKRRRRPTLLHAGASLGLALGVGILVLRTPHATVASGPVPPAAPGAGDWTAFGGTEAGTRYSALAQITPANVGRLKAAWTYRTGDMPGPQDRLTAWTFEATPLKIGDTLYVCTAHSVVHAIDAETGRRRWVYDPHSRNAWAPLRACRGVAYYRSAGPIAACAARIIAPTGDARLIALDAETGQPCDDFGRDGEVNLLEGLGDVTPGYIFTSSSPAVIDGKVVIGADVMDGATVGEPSGVIRAYDAVTGQLTWAWDMGHPERQGAPAANEVFTRGTPNAWPPLSADPALGLVYVPLGNPTPDMFGAYRSKVAETYGDALVALDAKDGHPRWSFQTTRHDLWDLDIPAQPSLVDFPTTGGPVPALIQPTKRGELFVLDRRTGQPLTEVTEKPAPGGAAAGDFTAPMQPYSVGMPSFVGPKLTEARMWGMTPLDQLWCRIRFRQLRYDGPLTPPSMQGTIAYPGDAGIFSWGGVAIDTARQVLIANTVHSPFVVQLIPRAEADRIGLSTPPNTWNATASSRGSPDRAAGAAAGMPQVGTPYAARALPFLSPLGVPCANPPWGRLSAVDLKTRRLLWQQPFGTAADTGPFGWRTGLSLPIGVPSAGGAVALASGLFFIAAAQDRYLRAYETATGRELWRARLPAGGQAGAMTYVANGRQFVAVAAGGHGGLNTAPGDYVVAYAL